MKKKTENKIKMRITYYGYSDGRKYIQDGKIHFSIDPLLEELHKSKSESCILSIFDGKREKTFSHFQDLLISPSNMIEDNRKKILSALSENKKTKKTYWYKSTGFAWYTYENQEAR